jgi:hypothetical protein
MKSFVVSSLLIALTNAQPYCTLAQGNCVCVTSSSAAFNFPGTSSQPQLTLQMQPIFEYEIYNSYVNVNAATNVPTTVQFIIPAIDNTGLLFSGSVNENGNHQYWNLQVSYSINSTRACTN